MSQPRPIARPIEVTVNGRRYSVSGDSAVVEAAFADQAQRARDGVRSSQPCWRSRRAFRSAAQAGTKPGLRRGRSSGKVAYVLLLAGWRRTDGAAINPAVQRANEELAVEARVS